MIMSIIARSVPCKTIAACAITVALGFSASVCVAQSAQLASSQLQAADQAQVSSQSVAAAQASADAATQETVAVPGSVASSASPAGVKATSLYGSASGASQSGTGSHLLSVTLALGFIVVLILGASWFIRRFGAGGFIQNSQMKILTSLALGTRERLILVDVAGKQLLLGVTATHISCLHEFEEPVILAESSAPNSEFGRKLMEILQQKKSATQAGVGENPGDLPGKGA